MSTTVMSIKTEKELKEKAQKLAKKIGFPLGTLINAFLRQFIRDEAINFAMKPQVPYRMNMKLEKELAAIHKDIKRGKNMSPIFKDIEEALDYLDKGEI